MKYILHIGYGKTGTTAIQHFLSQNRRILAQKGFLYPDIKRYGFWLNLPNHNLFGLSLSGKCGWTGLNPEEYILQFTEQIRQNPKFHTVLLSAETLAGGIQPWNFENESEYWEAQDKKIHRLKELLIDCETKIIVYLRRQDEWIDSAINQTIRYEGLMHGFKFQSVGQFVEVMRPRFDYEKVLATWERSFGRHNILLGVYDMSRLFNGNIVDDYLAMLGIEHTTHKMNKANKGPTKKNSRLPRDLIEFKRILNKTSRPSYREKYIANILYRLSSMMQEKTSGNHSFLDQEARQMIFNEYLSGNKTIVHRYINDMENCSLIRFDRNINGCEHRYAGLSREKFDQIYSLYKKEYHSIRNQIKLFSLYSGQKIRNNFPRINAMQRHLRLKLNTIHRRNRG